MRLEIHLHAYLEMCEGVTRKQVEKALQPLFEYLDVEGLKEVQSLEQDQPGMVYHQHEFSLEICCTLEVGGSFFPALEKAMSNIGILLESATAVEVIIYRDDASDEMQLIFVGPSPEAIFDAQRRRMSEDVGALLRRHFSESATREVLDLVNTLFKREGGKLQGANSEQEAASPMIAETGGRHRLH